MKRKLLSTLLVAAMVFTLGGSAVFAAEMPSGSGSVRYDSNTDGEGLADDATAFDTAGDNKTTVDEYYSLTKAAGTDDGTLDYYVTVEWSRTSGSATAQGDSYHWDASKQMYERTTVENTLTDNTPATVEIKVTNYSNAKVDYEISYVTAEAFDTTETATEGSKTGTLANYISYQDAAGTTVANEGIENGSDEEGGNKDTGAASYTHTHTAPTASYKGSVSLNANSKTVSAFTYQVVGTYTINLKAAALTRQTVSASVESGEDTTLTSSVSPESELGGTSVTFPDEVAALTDGSKAALTVDATAAVGAASQFTVVDTDTNVSLGALDLTLKVTETDSATKISSTRTVSEFKDEDGNAVAVTVSTYIAKGIANFGFSYNGTAFTKVDNESDVDAANEVWYYPESGKLVFATTHFSTYVIEGSNVAYVEENNTAYETLEAAITAAADKAYTITLLKDVDWTETYTGADSTKRVCFDLTDDVLDMNGHTIHTAAPYYDEDLQYNWPTVRYTGENMVIKNGTFTSGEKDTTVSYALYLGTGGYSEGPQKAILENVTSDGGINCYASEVTLKNVTAKGTNYYAVYGTSGSQITIESGNYSAIKCSVFNDLDIEDLITVNGGTITATGEAVIALNHVIFPATSKATCNKTPGDEFTEKPYGFVQNGEVWEVAKVYNWKVSYKQESYVTFDTWDDVVAAVTSDPSKVFINLSFYQCNNPDGLINAYTPLSDTETIVGFKSTAPTVYGWGVNGLGGETKALACYFKYESAEKTEYFKTETEADSCVDNHSGAVKAAIE